MEANETTSTKSKQNLLINLVFSTCDRKDAFQNNVETLIKHNPDISSYTHMVYLLDDRSCKETRNHFETLMETYFPNKYRMVTFNDHTDPYTFVEKMNFLKNISSFSPTKYTLFIEDDWECIDPLNLEYHINYLEANPDVAQIVFSKFWDIQYPEVKEATHVDDMYWSTWEASKTKQGGYKHCVEVKDGNFVWVEVKPTWTTNPSLNRNSTYYKGNFECTPTYEWDYSEKMKHKTLAVKHGKFVHSGFYNSMEPKGKWNLLKESLNK